MTNAITPEAAEAVKAAAGRAFRSGTHDIHTSSVLTSAAELLAGMRDAARDRGVEPGDFNTSYGDIVDSVLAAQIEAFDRRQPDDVDPLPLVAEAVRVTAERVGQPLEIVDGPTAINFTDDPSAAPSRAYAVIRRLPQTPAWAWGGLLDGGLDLVVQLDREILTETTFCPWRWALYPEKSGGRYVTVIAPPPSPQAAAEVAVIISQILFGEIHPW